MIQGATPFSYAGISADDYDMMLYYLSDPGVFEEPLYTVDVIEERLENRHSPIYLGVTDNSSALTREIIFGAVEYTDREIVDEVARWLSPSNGYQKLVIEQDDLEDYYYLCIFQDLQMVSINGLPLAFRATLVFYDQFAHEEPTTTAYQVQDGQVLTNLGELKSQLTLVNESSLHDYMWPKVTLTIPTSCDEFSIINHSDKNGARPFTFKNLSEVPTTDGRDLIIEINNETKVISSPNCGNMRQLYKSFGDSNTGYRYFFRLLQGENILSFVGSALVEIELEVLRKVAMQYARKFTGSYDGCLWQL